LLHKLSIVSKSNPDNRCVKYCKEYLNGSDYDYYDVKKLGQDELSMRVRVGRNLLGFNLPGEMDKDERIKF